MDLDIRKIHETTMQILEEAGVKFHHPEVLDIIRNNGVEISGDTVFFTRDRIMEWVGKAPGKFMIYARNPNYNMPIGGDHTEFISSNSGFPLIADINGVTRPALLDDYLTFLKLVHQTPYFNINGGVMVTPSDLKADAMYPVMLYYTVMHSDKCLFGGLGGAEESKTVMDMLGIIFGSAEELIAKPRIVTIISPLSPLQFDKTMLDTMLIYARHGQPMIIAPAVMAGTTGPITLAGTIALSNAEALAGIAAAQMIREGTPVIYGSASSTADMKTASFAIGAPESALCAAYCARLAKTYGLPCRGGGTLNDAKCISMQAGYESMMVMLVACQEKMNFILHSAGSLDSYRSMSYEKFIIDLEIIGMVKRFTRGVITDPDALALDVIKQVGSGGQFLSSVHTMEHCRQEPWTPDIGIRGPMAEENPNDRVLANIIKKKDKMLSEYQAPQFSEDIRSKLEKYLQDRNFELPV